MAWRHDVNKGKNFEISTKAYNLNSIRQLAINQMGRVRCKETG